MADCRNPGVGAVAIDIGHSISSPGAMSASGIGEFSFNRNLAFYIAQSLERAGFKPKIINPDGATIALTDRTAEADGTEFFLSIHHDSVQLQFLKEWVVSGRKHLRSEGFKGYSIFVSRRNRFLRQSLECASAIGGELRKKGFIPSQYHAADIKGERKPFADKPNGVHYYDDLIVLKTARSPAALLEAGVITDHVEEQQLSAVETRMSIANAVVIGLQACL